MNTQPPTVSLFLRSDASLLLVRGDSTIEIALSPAQILALGVDCLRVATALNSRLMPEAAEALANTHVLPATEAEWSSPLN